MKKSFFLSVIMAILICSSNAFAIDPTYYSASASSITSSSSPIIPGLLTSYTFSWSLSPNPGELFTDATLDIFGSGSTLGSSFVVAPKITFGFYQLYSAPSLGFNSGVAHLTLYLPALNAYIASNHTNNLDFIFNTTATNASVTGATLTGHTAVAPEPISMALVAAGLVGLPFARRLRKAVTKEV